MMKNDNYENLISKLFAQLPRKTFVSGRKDKVWLGISSQIFQKRTRHEFAGMRLGGLLDIIFLRGFSGKLSAVSLIVVVAISVAGGVVRAMPGGTLYPVKKAVEQVEKALAVSSEQKFEVATKHADRRLKEVKQLVESNQEPAVVTKTLEELRETTQEAVAITANLPELQADAIALTERGESILSSVEPKAPQDVKEAIASVKESLIKLKPATSDTALDEEIKGIVTVEELPESQSVSTSTVKITLSQPAVKKLKKNILPKVIQGDAPIESGIDIHDISKVGPTGDPVPAESIIDQPEDGF